MCFTYLHKHSVMHLSVFDSQSNTCSDLCFKTFALPFLLQVFGQHQGDMQVLLCFKDSDLPHELAGTRLVAHSCTIHSMSDQTFYVASRDYNEILFQDDFTMATNASILHACVESCRQWSAFIDRLQSWQPSEYLPSPGLGLIDFLLSSNTGLRELYNLLPDLYSNRELLLRCLLLQIIYRVLY